MSLPVPKVSNVCSVFLSEFTFCIMICMNGGNHSRRSLFQIARMQSLAQQIASEHRASYLWVILLSTPPLLVVVRVPISREEVVWLCDAHGQGMVPGGSGGPP